MFLESLKVEICHLTIHTALVSGFPEYSRILGNEYGRRTSDIPSLTEAVHLYNLILVHTHNLLPFNVYYLTGIKNNVGNSFFS